MTIDEVRRAFLRDVALTPEAKAAIIAALDVAEACVDWVGEGELCHTCGGVLGHQDECPVGAFAATIRPASGGEGT